MSRDVDAFLRAAADGDLQTVRSTLVHRPDLANAAGAHPFWGGRPTAVMLAAEWGRLDVLRFLLEYGADPDSRQAEYDGWSPLLCGIVKNHPDAVELLIEHGATLDAFAAAALGDEIRLDSILRADPGAATRIGPNRGTPLHFAASAGTASLLLAAGADPAAVDLYGRTPLRSAAYAGLPRREVARRLLPATGEMDVFIACALGDARAVREWLDREPGLLHAKDTALGPSAARGATPLHMAAALGEVDVARLLLNRGADPDALSTDGHAPLHYAAGRGHSAMIELLRERGATLELRDSEHDATPADWARFFGRSEAEAMLRTSRED